MPQKNAVPQPMRSEGRSSEPPKVKRFPGPPDSKVYIAGRYQSRHSGDQLARDHKQKQKQDRALIRDALAEMDPRAEYEALKEDIANGDAPDPYEFCDPEDYVSDKEWDRLLGIDVVYESHGVGMSDSEADEIDRFNDEAEAE